MSEHYCAACGELHGGADVVPPEVEIARINAKRDVEVARLQRKEAEELAVIDAETAVETTELETTAAVAVAEELPSEPDPEPDTAAVIVEGPVADADASADDEPTIEPMEENLPEPETAPKSRGYWG